MVIGLAAFVQARCDSLIGVLSFYLNSTDPYPDPTGVVLAHCLPNGQIEAYWTVCTREQALCVINRANSGWTEDLYGSGWIVGGTIQTSWVDNAYLRQLKFYGAFQK